MVAVVVLSFALAAWVAAPLWTALLLGVVMAISAQRPFAMLVRRMGESRSHWAAGIVTLASGIGMGVVGILVLFTATSELMKVLTHLDIRTDAGTLGGLIGENNAEALAKAGVDPTKAYAWFKTELTAATSYVATLAAVAIRTTTWGILGLVVALMTMYYVLIDGARLARRIERIAPLEPRHTRALLIEARDVGRTAFVGTIATALVQGILGGIGFAMMGVPEPVTWGLATAVASFLPVVGTAMVWAPISAWLLMQGHPVKAVLLVSWGFVVVTSFVDYWVRPKIVGAHGHHPLLTLIALLGGIEVFGLAGLIVAPIVMSVFVAAFRLYEREVRSGGTNPSIS